MQPKTASLLAGVGLASVAGVFLQLVGYLIVRGAETEFGWVMFLVVPFVSGYAVGAIVRGPLRVAAACIVTGVITFSVMLFAGWESIVCCLMSLPLVAAGVTGGAVLGYVTRGRFLDANSPPPLPTILLIAASPLVIAAAERFERPYRAMTHWETVTTEVIVPTSMDETWRLLAEFPTLDGDRPLLLRMGLPVPHRCELDRTEVGGTRVCHFDNGTITQEIVEWHPPISMALKVTANTLPGRHWLTFDSARYELKSTPEGTRVVRQTSMGSRLYPRWYWRPLERLGVGAEHEFVLSSLRKRAVASGATRPSL